MGIHPNKHLSLEEVRKDNPEFYKSLLVYRAEQERSSEVAPMRVPAKSTSTTIMSAGGTRDFLDALQNKSLAKEAVPDPAAVLKILQNMQRLPKPVSVAAPSEVSAQKG